VDNYDKLRQKATELGADLFGVTERLRLEKYIDDEIKEVARNLPFVVSLAIRVQRSVFDTLKNGPNVLYKNHYRTANFKLDQIAFGIGQFIQAVGFEALPIPASVITDWEHQRSHLSHRHAAMEAGLGYLGRSGLLVHPEYGSAIRLASILTNMPLRTDAPMNIDCGDCFECIAACPVGAISPEGMVKFDGEACYSLLREFEKRRNIGVMICGLCIKACRGSKHD